MAHEALHEQLGVGSSEVSGRGEAKRLRNLTKAPAAGNEFTR